MGRKAKRRAEKLARRESKAAAARGPRVEVMADTAARPPPLRISQRTLDAASTQPELFAQTPWEIARPPPGVVPDDVMAEIAADASIGSLYGYGQTNSFTDGMQWLGYPYLSELAQRPEYRRMVEQIAKEMTRKWIKLHAAGDDTDKDKSRRLKIIEGQLKRHRVQAKFRRLAEFDGFFGRGHLYIDTGHTAEPDELAIPLVRDKRKIGVGGLKRLKLVEPLWTYPFDYNTTDPLNPDFYRPRQWFVQGRKVHRSRLLTVIGREVPDMLKPAYAFGGVALTQMAKPYVENWLRTRQSVSDLIHSFSVSGLKTNLASTIAEVGADPLLKRIALFNRTRDNRGMLMIDKDSEEFFNVSTPLGTLDHLQAQAQEQMASICGIPLVVLLGITPSGLNASSDGEIKTWYSWIEAMQEHLFDDDLRVLLDIIQLSEFGEIDPEITHSWEPLWQLDEAGRAQVRKTDAETDMTYTNGGVIAPLEVRRRLADAEDSLYPGLDVDDLPEPPGGGMEDVDPLTGLPDPANANDPPALAPGDPARPAKPKAPISPLQLAGDAWQEDDVKRANNGQFSTSGGGGGGAVKKAGKVEDVSGWKKIGPQLGGNPGGKYESPEGDHYYIKQSKSDDHAKNEVLAGKLYQAAKAPVFHSRLVDTGGGKLGTSSKWKGDATDIKPSSKAERKEAQQHFATHAWLANHDAGGTDTYNQGKLNGVMHTMDVGGALNYAGLGGEKGAAFGHEAGEWDTMRQKGTASAKVHAIFADMTPAELKASAEKVAAIPDATIAALVEEHGPGDAAAKAAMTAKLIARKNDIAKKAGIEAKPAASEAPAESTPAAEASAGVQNQAFEDAHLRGPDGKFLPKPDDDSSEWQKELYDFATEKGETVENKIFSVQDMMLESKDPEAVAYGQKLLDGLTAPAAPATEAAPAAVQSEPPAPPGYAGASTKKIAGIAKAGIGGGKSPQEIADAIKAHVAGYAGKHEQSYGNTVIAHLEKANGLAPGSLGKAAGKSAGGNPSPAVPTPPAPAVSPLAIETPPATPGLPAPPVPQSTATQQYIDQYAKSDLGDVQDKIKTLAIFAASSTTSPEDAAFTNAWITALGGTPEAAAPTPAPAAATSGPAIPAGKEKSAMFKSLQTIGEAKSITLENKIQHMKDKIDAGIMSPEADDYANAWIEHLSGEAVAVPAPEPTPTGPMPHPDSAPQKAVYAIANGAGTNAEKADKIKAEAAGMYPGGYAKAYADEWITALGGDPATPAKPAPAPAKPKAAAKPKAPPANANSVKAPAARAAKGEALEASAKRPTSTSNAESVKIAPSLSPEFWQKIPAKTKASVASYGGHAYTSINTALRGIDASEASKQHIENLDDLFYHDESITTEPVMVVRGEDTPSTLIAEWKAALTKGWPPCIYTRTGYTSASMAHSPAFSSKPVWLHFAAPKGTRMVGLAGLVGHHENEVLLQHGQTMEVYEIYEANGKTHVKCTLK